MDSRMDTRMDIRKWLYPIALIAFVCIWVLLDKPLTLHELLQHYWVAGITMLAGSFVAGITPLGGGAVAFPVFTKLLNVSAYDAKLFSLAIQAVGMSFASLFLISRKAQIYWRVIWVCLPVCIITLPIALHFSVYNNAWLKFAFSEFILITAFIIWLCQNTQPKTQHLLTGKKIWLMLSAGLGSFLSANLGSGSDVILFFMLVFVLKYSVKQAIPTTIILMAFNALYATLWFSFINPVELNHFVINSWWLACLVVAVGAPLGSWVLLNIRERYLRRFIYFIISLEVLSTLYIANLPVYLNIGLIVTLLVIIGLANQKWILKVNG